MTLESPTVDKDEVERFSRIADEWWDEHGKFKPLHSMNPLRLTYIRNRIASHYGRNIEQPTPLAGISLLDIGCGGGLLCEPLARLGAEVTGIDASEKNIRVAALHAEQAGVSGVTYRCTTAEQLTTQYDVVLAMEVIEHVADVSAFLHAITQATKPGGIIFLSTLNRTVKSYAMAIVGAEYILRWLPRGTHEWRKFLKPSELCASVRRAGLAVEHMAGAVYNPFNNSWSLSEHDLDVNYLLTAFKR